MELDSKNAVIEEKQKQQELEEEIINDSKQDKTYEHLRIKA